MGWWSGVRGGREEADERERGESVRVKKERPPFRHRLRGRSCLHFISHAEVTTSIQYKNSLNIFLLAVRPDEFWFHFEIESSRVLIFFEQSRIILGFQNTKTKYGRVEVVYTRVGRFSVFFFSFFFWKWVEYWFFRAKSSARVKSNTPVKSSTRV